MRTMTFDFKDRGFKILFLRKKTVESIEFIWLIWLDLDVNCKLFRSASKFVKEGSMLFCDLMCDLTVGR